MKVSFILASCFIYSLSSVCQEENQKLPPFHMLPKDSGEVKEIYDLPYESIYEIYSVKGELVQDSIGEFIDMTRFNKGAYFIKFEGKTFKYEKTTEKPKLKKPELTKKLIYDPSK